MEAIAMQARRLALILCMAGCGGHAAAPGPAAPTAPSAPEASTASPAPAPAAEPGKPGKPAAPMGMAHGGTALVAPKVAAELEVPAGNKLTFMAIAKGVQIYECAADAGGAMAWKLHAPRADLVDDAGNKLAAHFGGVDKNLPPGPYWESADGSRVHGAKPVSVANAGSIPLLRLEAADTSGAGVFSKVAFIQRLETTGGVAPAGGCATGKTLAGKTTEVPYTAKYYFYSTP
jgi:uncharacterized protein DUF3455